MLRPTFPPSRLLRPTPSPIFRQLLSTQPQHTQTPVQPPPEPQTQSKRSYPFVVGRSGANNFSVYQLAKRGGNLKLTLVKKVEGNRIAFKEELAKGLKLSAKDIKVSSLTGHVEVRGHRKSEIVAFLEEKGL
ncbi:mitochondrial large subunit ribosomal protein-domain-containing protein [Apiosordaria backusii]|uniref:Large ribosomal subunit protein mL49 n=1 Tax=Apiosordaria backusii TaxID=314023 RepID=A0AA40DLZ4_9PEZI|nr:mitochondrial large subunit ribosomal protein-domain-containing protein [Apiosordaria backusii]